MDRIRSVRDRFAFDLWYLFAPPWDTGISPPELLEFLHTHPPGRAIDLGCGTGTNIITLAGAGWKTEGIDFSPRAIRAARRKLRQHGVDCRVSVCDVTRMNGVAGPFDLALDIGCYHTVGSRDSYLTNLARLLAPGGHWLMYGFVRDGVSPGERGVGPRDLDLIRSHGFRLLSRRDGTDHGNRPSAWFLHQRLET
jgi:cyclopropane fatty-acyl-phospholipid synthase-like methyltransferase